MNASIRMVSLTSSRDDANVKPPPSVSRALVLTKRMNGPLLRLRDQGNTVRVVEHKPEMIAIADPVVDFGPGVGTAGGQLVFEATRRARRFWHMSCKYDSYYPFRDRFEPTE